MTALSPTAPPGVLTSEGLATDLVCFPTRDQYVELVASLRDDGFEMCVDLCGVDYLEHFDRVAARGRRRDALRGRGQSLSLSKKERVRLRVQAGDDAPEVDSLFALYPGTEAMEREAFDLFGILFTNHPDLTRILMPEEWEGHPLRKDYGAGRVPVQFKESPGPR